MNESLWRWRLRGPVFGLMIAALMLASTACSSGSDDLESVESAEEGEEGEEQESGTDGRVVLTEAAHQTAAIEVSEVLGEAGALASGTVQVPGRVEFPPDRVALVSPRTGGRIERLLAVEGNRVGAGQPVAYILSPAFLTAQNDFMQAVRRADLLAGTPDEEGARALVSAAQRRLQLLGAPGAVIERLQSGGEPLDLLPVVAPFAGVVVEANALTGAAVEPGSPIYRIADLSAVDVVADVPEQAIRHLAVGQSATVRLAAYPESPYTGRIERLRSELNRETRTVAAIIRVPNPQGSLRPGMFATVDLAVPVTVGAGASPTSLTIPASALVTDGADRYVFVEVGLRTYERRLVDVVPAGNETVAVRSGLAAGERIVTRGAFTLKSELGKAAFGDDD